MKAYDYYNEIRMLFFQFALAMYGTYKFFVILTVSPGNSFKSVLPYILWIINTIYQSLMILRHYNDLLENRTDKLIYHNYLTVLNFLLNGLFLVCFSASQLQTEFAIYFAFILEQATYNSSILKPLYCYFMSYLMTVYLIDFSTRPLCFLVIWFTIQIIFYSSLLLIKKAKIEIELSQQITEAMNKMTETLTNALINALPSKILPKVLYGLKLPCDVIDNVSYVYISLKNASPKNELLYNNDTKIFLSKVNYYYCALDYLSEICNIYKIKSNYSYYMACVGAQSYLISKSAKKRETDYANNYDKDKLLIYFTVAAQYIAKLFDLYISAGLTHGSIILGVLESGGENYNFDTYGDTVNTAARIAQNSSEGIHIAISYFLQEKPQFDLASQSLRLNAADILNRTYSLNEYIAENDIFLPVLMFLLQLQPTYLFKNEIVKQYKGKGKIRTVLIYPTKAFENSLYQVLNKANACYILDSMHYNEESKTIQGLLDSMSTSESVISQQNGNSSYESTCIDFSYLQLMLNQEYMYLDYDASSYSISQDSMQNSKNAYIITYFNNQLVKKELEKFKQLTMYKKINSTDLSENSYNELNELQSKNLFSLSSELNKSDVLSPKRCAFFDESIPEIKYSCSCNVDICKPAKAPEYISMGINHIESSSSEDLDMNEKYEQEAYYNVQQAEKTAKNNILPLENPFALIQASPFVLQSSETNDRKSSSLSFRIYELEESKSEVMDSCFFKPAIEVKIQQYQYFSPSKQYVKQYIDLQKYNKYYAILKRNSINYFALLFSFCIIILKIEELTFSLLEDSNIYFNILMKAINNYLYYLLLLVYCASAIVVIIVVLYHCDQDRSIVFMLMKFKPIDLFLVINAMQICVNAYLYIIRIKQRDCYNNNKQVTRIRYKTKMFLIKKYKVYYHFLVCISLVNYVLYYVLMSNPHVRAAFDAPDICVLVQVVVMISYLLNISTHLSFVATPTFYLTRNFKVAFLANCFLIGMLIRHGFLIAMLILTFIVITETVYIVMAAIYFKSVVDSIEQVNYINNERYLMTGILPKITIDGLLATSSPEALSVMIHSFPFLRKYENQFYQLYDMNYLVKNGAFYSFPKECDRKQYILSKLQQSLRIPNFRLLSARRPVISFRNVAYLNLDITNFTQFSSRAPVEMTLGFLNSLFKLFDYRLLRAKNLIQIKISGDSYEILALPCVIKVYQATPYVQEQFHPKIPESMRLRIKTPENLRAIFDAIQILIGMSLGFIRDCHYVTYKLGSYYDYLHLRVGIAFGDVIGSLLGNKLSRFDTFGATPAEACEIYEKAKIDTVAVSKEIFELLNYGQLQFNYYLIGKSSQLKALQGQPIQISNEVVEFNYEVYKGYICIDRIVGEGFQHGKLRKTQSLKITSNNEW